MTALWHNVAHVFEFGLRPEPMALTDVGSLPDTLSIEDVLRPADLFCPIVHPTTYSKSGWGVRALTSDELGVRLLVSRFGRGREVFRLLTSPSF